MKKPKATPEQIEWNRAEAARLKKLPKIYKVTQEQAWAIYETCNGDSYPFYRAYESAFPKLWQAHTMLNVRIRVRPSAAERELLPREEW